jgi:DNA-binding transcriptional LysR family regulator
MNLFSSMQAFVTAVQTGSMSAAASKLRMSPAMVGQHVAALEDRLGTKLLNRTTRRQSLTDFGASYYEQCRDILDRVSMTDREAETLQSMPRGKLRITAPTTFGTEALVPALRAYREIAKDVSLDLMLTDRNVDLVEEGFDVAFRIGTLPDSRLIARRLTPYSMVICASPEYIKRKGEPKHPTELTMHEVVGFTPAAGSAWRLSKNGDLVEVTPPISMTVNNGQALRMAARSGLGVVMQPAILLLPDVQTGKLVQLLTDWQLNERSMSLLYYRDQHMTPRLRSFISFAISAFGEKTDSNLFNSKLLVRNKS